MCYIHVIIVIYSGNPLYRHPYFLETMSSAPFFFRDSRASETRGRVKITPREKRRHATGREKNEGLQTKPRLLNLCVAFTTQNSDWLFQGNLSTSVKNAPAAINTRHNHNLQNK